MTLVTLHDDELTDLAYDRLGAERLLLETDRTHRECPGCTNLVHHTNTLAHATTCQALRAWVQWEASEGKY